MVVALLVGCGGSSERDLAVLPASAVPELESTTEEVTADDLAADFGTAEPSFRGFVTGRERVVSRPLSFENAKDARAYLGYFRAHLPLAYGSGTTATPLESEGRGGFLV